MIKPAREVAVEALIAHANHMGRQAYSSERAILEVTATIERDRREVVEAARVWIERLATHLESAIEVIWNDGIDPGEDEVASGRAIVTEALSFARSLSPKGTTPAPKEVTRG